MPAQLRTNTQAGKLLITLRDKVGKAFKTESYPIDLNATRIVISPTREDVPLSPPPGAHGPVTTRTASATITTPTQQVVISQIFYFSKGSLSSAHRRTAFSEDM